MAIINIGKGTRLISDKRQSAVNINSSMAMMESKSEIIGIRPLEKISLMDSISFMVRVVNVPIGVLSNCRKFRLNTFL